MYLTLVLRIAIDFVQTIGTLIHTLVAPFLHANPAGQLMIIVVVLAFGYAAVRYIITGGRETQHERAIWKRPLLLFASS